MMINCFKVVDSFLEAKKRSTWRLLSVVFGGILIQIVFGFVYTFGNLTPYMTSYMRHTGVAPTLTYTECAWFYAVCYVGEGMSMPFSGHLENKLGLRWAALFGSCVFCLGLTLTYFSIQHSFPGVILTQGLLAGIGCGMAYALPLSCSMKWLKDNPGMASGIVNGGVGITALIFNTVQTVFINPENKKVHSEGTEERYFDQPDIIERVPYAFLLLGGCYGLMLLVGCMLLTNPPEEKVTKISCTDGNLTGNVDNDATLPLIQQENNSVLFKQERNAEDNSDLSPIQALKTKDFYILFFLFLFNGLGVSFLSALYKAYGLSFINDDIFLSMVGTTAAVFNSLGRIVLGILADKISFTVTSICTSAMFTVLMLTLQVTQYTTKYLYMIYVCLLWFAGSGTFTLIPAATAKRFGKKHLTTIYGMLFLSQSVSVPLAIGLPQALQSTVGWNWVFVAVGGLSFLGVILAWLYNGKDKDGSDV